MPTIYTIISVRFCSFFGIYIFYLNQFSIVCIFTSFHRNSCIFYALNRWHVHTNPNRNVCSIEVLSSSLSGNSIWIFFLFFPSLFLCFQVSFISHLLNMYDWVLIASTPKYDFNRFLYLHCTHEPLAMQNTVAAIFIHFVDVCKSVVFKVSLMK